MVDGANHDARPRVSRHVRGLGARPKSSSSHRGGGLCLHISLGELDLDVVLRQRGCAKALVRTDRRLKDLPGLDVFGGLVDGRSGLTTHWQHP